MLMAEVNKLTDRIDQLELIIEKRMRLDMFRQFIGKTYIINKKLKLDIVDEEGYHVKHTFKKEEQFSITGIDYYRTLKKQLCGKEYYDYERYFFTDMEIGIRMTDFVNEVLKGRIQCVAYPKEPECHIRPSD